MFVGLDIRSDSVLAVQLDADGIARARALREGRTAAMLAAAVRAVVNGSAVERLGAAAQTGDAIEPVVAEVAGAVHARQTTTISTGAAIALAEHWQGAALGADNVVSLSIDEHVSSGIIVNGQVFRGVNGRAGNAAWLALNPVERDDYRRLGGLEAEISAAGIARRLVWRIKTGDPSRAQDLAGGELTAIKAVHVFDAARENDGVAVSVVRDTARYIGMAVANLIAVIDPDVVVLGGLIAHAADLLIEPSSAEVARRLPSGSVPKILAGTLGDEAAGLGAARAAMLQ